LNIEIKEGKMQTIRYINEKLANILTIVNSLDTDSLNDLLVAIEGSGFSTTVDSLKVLSDVLDLVKIETDKMPATITKVDNIKTETDKIPATITKIDNILSSLALTGDSVVANVIATKTFYKDNAQTKLTGTMPNNAGDVASVAGVMGAGTTLKVTPAMGYTDGIDDKTTIDLTTVDADLVTDNIKAGVTILGVAGKTEVVDTSSGDAVAGDIIATKKAWVDGVEVTGNITVRNDIACTSSSVDGTTLKLLVPAGYYDGTKNVTITDADFVNTNILTGVDIFGVTGNHV
jgi:hypothetical protein